MPSPVLAELQRRRVFRATVTYGVAAFAVLQIAEPIMHALHWPEGVLTWIVLALAAGFPLVVGLAWIFDFREGRIERTPRAGGHTAAQAFAAPRRRTGRRWTSTPTMLRPGRRWRRSIR